jgi:hypothetical protein
MEPAKWVRLGVFLGIGIGFACAYLMLLAECHNAPGMVALSSFGAVMALFGAVRIYYALRPRH